MGSRPAAPPRAKGPGAPRLGRSIVRSAAERAAAPSECAQPPPRPGSWRLSEVVGVLGAPSPPPASFSRALRRSSPHSRKASDGGRQPAPCRARAPVPVPAAPAATAAATSRTAACVTLGPPEPAPPSPGPALAPPPARPGGTAPSPRSRAARPWPKPRPLAPGSPPAHLSPPPSALATSRGCLGASSGLRPGGAGVPRRCQSRQVFSPRRLRREVAVLLACRARRPNPAASPGTLARWCPRRPHCWVGCKGG